jgi:arylsulfatase A-like enzyme
MQVSDSPFSLLHLAPTLLEATGVSMPSGFDGSSHWEKLHRGESWDGITISESIASCTNPFHAQNRLGPRLLAVRDRQFKLLVQFDRPAEYLYDLKNDPYERVPLPPSAEQAARRRLLEAAREHVKQSIERMDPGKRFSARLRDFRLEWSNPAEKTSSASS